MYTSVLICYHSGEGQSAKVAQRISSTLSTAGCDVTVADALDDPSPVGCDGVVVGDSIHVGRHSRALRRWLARHIDALAGMPVAVFQVSLTSATEDDVHSAEAERLPDLLLDEAGLDPDLVGLFAGALAYTRYGWFKRRIMAEIAADRGDPTDTTRDHEYTDWGAVDRFASDAAVLFLLQDGAA